MNRAEGTELVSDVIDTGELQAWFLAAHLVDTLPVRASEPAAAS